MKTSMKRHFAKTVLGMTVATAIVLGGGCAALAQKPPTAASPLKVQFQEAKSKEALIKAYPFTKKMLADIVLQPAPNSGLSPSRVYFSNVTRQSAETKLFFLKLEGGDVCGSAGCMMTVYQDLGKGFVPVHDLYTLGPVYVEKQEDGRHTLIVCGGKGHTSISQQKPGETFSNPTPYAGKATLEPCSPGL